MRLAWLTDIHLNFLDDDGRRQFYSKVREVECDAFVITGDIGEAPSVARYLRELARALAAPIYFVLGNHDFYFGSMSSVRRKMSQLVRKIPNLTWLNETGVIELSAHDCLLGHDGWADGRLGDFFASPVRLNDFFLIEELREVTIVPGWVPFAHRGEIQKRIQSLGGKAADHIRRHLPVACQSYGNVILATHVPPFRESCWHNGTIASDDYLPFFTCAAVGEALVEIMSDYPRCDLTVICGHTHSDGEAQILRNLRVLTGGAEYTEPTIQHVLTV